MVATNCQIVGGLTFSTGGLLVVSVSNVSVSDVSVRVMLGVL